MTRFRCTLRFLYIFVTYGLSFTCTVYVHCTSSLWSIEETNCWSKLSHETWNWVRNRKPTTTISQLAFTLWPYFFRWWHAAPDVACHHCGNNLSVPRSISGSVMYLRTTWLICMSQKRLAIVHKKFAAMLVVRRVSTSSVTNENDDDNYDDDNGI